MLWYKGNLSTKTLISVCYFQSICDKLCVTKQLKGQGGTLWNLGLYSVIVSGYVTGAINEGRKHYGIMDHAVFI